MRDFYYSRIKGWRRNRRSARSLLPAVRAVDEVFSAGGCGVYEDRIASLLYKQAVEMDMAMSILLQSLNVSEEVLRQERAKSIAAVKRTNGQLRLEQKLRELESEAWQG